MTFLKAIPFKLPVVKSQKLKAQETLVTAAGKIVHDLANYPPQQPTPYRRTGTLGRGWKYRVTSSGQDLIITIENPVAYATFVQGEDQTAVMASKGWREAITVIEANTAGLQEKIQASLKANIDIR